MPQLNSEKLVAMVAILIAVAPLSSIYHVFNISMHSQVSSKIVKESKFHEVTNEAKPDDETDLEGETKENQKFIRDKYKIIRENIDIGAVFNADIDQFIQAIFKKRIHPNTLSPFYFLAYGFGETAPGGAFFRMHHWSLILPWCFSIVLGIIVPLYHALVYDRQGNRRRRNDDDDLDRLLGDVDRLVSEMEKNQKRKEKITALFIAFKDFSKKLEKCDMLMLNEGSSDIDNNSRMILLPPPGVRKSKKSQYECRRTSDTCPICLMQFEINDVVVWSSNEKCQDVFHEHCILTWLCRKRKRVQDCPCCRQIFVHTDVLRDSLKKIDQTIIDQTG